MKTKTIVVALALLAASCASAADVTPPVTTQCLVRGNANPVPCTWPPTITPTTVDPADGSIVLTGTATIDFARLEPTGTAYGAFRGFVRVFVNGEAMLMPVYAMPAPPVAVQP